MEPMSRGGKSEGVVYTALNLSYPDSGFQVSRVIMLDGRWPSKPPSNCLKTWDSNSSFHIDENSSPTHLNPPVPFNLVV